MITMKSLLTLLLIALFAGGCGADKKPLTTAPKPLPSWYSNPPQSNERTLYEVAEGRDKKEAIANALDLMVSTLSITVASQYKSQTTVRSGAVESYQHDADNTVSTDVKAIRISNYRVVEGQEQGFRRYLVLIESDKRQLFESLKKEWDEILLLLETQEPGISHRNVIEQLRFYKQADRDLSAIEPTLNVMHVLNGSFDTAPYLTAIGHYRDRYGDLRARITFSFNANDAARHLVEPLKAGLSAQGLLIREQNDPYHLRIQVNASVETVKSMGFDLARTAINLSTQAPDGTTIGSNAFNITGQSTQGYAVAKENVAIKLNALIKKEGIQSILGMDF